MSSFGSYRSRTGVGRARAAATFSIPKPDEESRPTGAMSVAERRRISATCPAFRSGRAVHTHAAAAATIGDEKLVPDSGRQSLPSALATLMSAPGAERST